MESLLSLLKKNNLTLGTVESMTGGLFASEFTSVSGASSVFKGSIVTYSIEEKINLVNVKKETVEKYTVVSKEVCEEMAKGGLKALNVDLCVSVTGNAGPTSDVGGKPVGLVFISLADKSNCVTKMLHLKGERNAIRNEAVNEIKKMLKVYLLNK